MSKRHTIHLSLIRNPLKRQLNMTTSCFNMTTSLLNLKFIIIWSKPKRKESDDLIATTLIVSCCVGNPQDGIHVVRWNNLASC